MGWWLKNTFIGDFCFEPIQHFHTVLAAPFFPVQLAEVINERHVHLCIHMNTIVGRACCLAWMGESNHPSYLGPGAKKEKSTGVWQALVKCLLWIPIHSQWIFLTNSSCTWLRVQTELSSLSKKYYLTLMCAESQQESSIDVAALATLLRCCSVQIWADLWLLCARFSGCAEKTTCCSKKVQEAFYRVDWNRNFAAPSKERSSYMGSISTVIR